MARRNPDRKDSRYTILYGVALIVPALLDYPEAAKSDS
jgi:hypothetical protein